MTPLVCIDTEGSETKVTPPPLHHSEILGITTANQAELGNKYPFQTKLVVLESRILRGELGLTAATQPGSMHHGS